MVTFISLSEELCGIPSFNLIGTGYAKLYYTTMEGIVGPDTVKRLLEVYKQLPACCQKDRKAALRAEILSHPEFGPIARNIIKLWYSATWFALPYEWHQQFGSYANDRTFIPEPYAYAESLLMPAVGAHPAGAKPTGHQSWVLPPYYLPVSESSLPKVCQPA